MAATLPMPPFSHTDLSLQDVAPDRRAVLRCPTDNVLSSREARYLNESDRLAALADVRHDTKNKAATASALRNNSSFICLTVPLGNSVASGREVLFIDSAPSSGAAAEPATPSAQADWRASGR
jgi:hypothetical protein